MDPASILATALAPFSGGENIVNGQPLYGTGRPVRLSARVSHWLLAVEAEACEVFDDVLMGEKDDYTDTSADYCCDGGFIKKSPFDKFGMTVKSDDPSVTGLSTDWAERAYSAAPLGQLDVSKILQNMSGQQSNILPDPISAATKDQSGLVFQILPMCVGDNYRFAGDMFVSKQAITGMDIPARTTAVFQVQSTFFSVVGSSMLRRLLLDGEDTGASGRLEKGVKNVFPHTFSTDYALGTRSLFFYQSRQSSYMRPMNPTAGDRLNAEDKVFPFEGPFLHALLQPYPASKDFPACPVHDVSWEGNGLCWHIPPYAFHSEYD